MNGNIAQSENIVPPDIIRRHFIAIAIIWSLLILGLFIWGATEITGNTDRILLSQARPFVKQIIIARLWNARHGGVYVPITDKDLPNPYLDIPNRDIETKDGMKLTLINPAYMTRQIAELAKQESNIIFHLTSDRPIRPANAPEPWEKEAIGKFKKKGDEYFERWTDGKGEHFFRYMKPVWTEKPCLQCHARLGGYQEGDLRGGLSVIIPAETAISNERQSIRFQAIAFTVIWLLGLVGLAVASREIRQRSKHQQELIERLENTLQGMVPICAGCKSIQNEEGEWEQLESYISNHSEAEFSHGLCPGCTEKYYGEHLKKGDGD